MPTRHALSHSAQTDRLELNRPTSDDLHELFAICSDPRVWSHFPSLRHTDLAQSASMLDRWMNNWDSDGLGTWVARAKGEPSIIGYGGCGKLHNEVWNLGYRFAARAHGRGYATELAQEALRHAKRVAPDIPVVAYLLEHDKASERVAQKLGMQLVHRGPDAGNPDSAAIRLVYATQRLSANQLTAALR
jgi:RimJ/RimL family protein N-acetyltransferase